MRAGLRMWNPPWISLATDWTPGSRVSTPESRSQVTVIALLFVVQGWIPTGVDSQKNRSDAGDMPRLAPQHTFSARKEPENNGLGFLLSPARSPDDPEKLSLPSHPVNRLPLAFRTVWTPIWIPVRTLGSTTASIPKPFALAVTCTRLSRAYPIHTRPGGDCLAFRCLAEKCLTRCQGLDRPVLDPCCRCPMFPV